MLNLFYSDHEFYGVRLTCQNIHPVSGYYSEHYQCSTSPTKLRPFQQRYRIEWERLSQSDDDVVTLLAASYYAWNLGYQLMVV